MEPINGDKLRGHLEVMILSSLERGEAHGLEILRRLEEAGCGLLRLKEGSLYPALYRLEAAGDQIRGRWAEARAKAIEEGRPYRFATQPDGQYKIAPDTADNWSGGDATGGESNDSDSPPLVIEETLPDGGPSDAD